MIIALAAVPVVFIMVSLMVYMCICGTCFCSDERGFYTLVIKGAPSAAKVFVNEIEFPVQQENGEIKLEYLRSGIVHNVRILHESYENFVFSVADAEGEIKEFTVQMTAVQDTRFRSEP
jgi:hypothetical protein